jgi:hypothetical protein
MAPSDSTAVMARRLIVLGGLILACLAPALTSAVGTVADAASPEAPAATLPLVARAPTVTAVGPRVAGSATIVNSGTADVRPTLGFLSVRPVSGGDLIGIAGFSVPGLAVGASAAVHFSTGVGMQSPVIAPGAYRALVCLDVDSQIQTFVARIDCTPVGTITIAGSGRHRARSPMPNTIITAAPMGVVGRSSAVLAFGSTAPGSTFQCRLDDGPWVLCPSPEPYTALVDGRHTFDVRAVNSAGVPDRSPARAAWIVDTRLSSELATPYMGWNTYYGVGGVYDEKTIISVARALIDRGLARAGYRIVWLDYGWASGRRDSHGELIVNPRQWPHGLAWLTAWLHARGLLAGIYTDAGASGCNGEGVGSVGHYQEDANAFAAWGFDAVKMDFCGAGQEGLDPKSAYDQFATALANNSSRRFMLLNVCNFWVPGQINGTRPSFADSAYANVQWAPRIAQSWRTDTDIGFTGNIQFVNVLRNLDADAAHPRAAGPGHWNDPDYLGPELGMTNAQAQAQLSMWAIVAAPLILGSDPRTLSPATITMLENPQVIAVDQDSLGIQGTPIQQDAHAQVWVKPLVNGSRAVALLNRGGRGLRISTDAHAIGLSPAGAYVFENLWTYATDTTTGRISAWVPPDSAVLYRVSTA